MTTATVDPTCILIEEETPYDRSLKWTIHHRYFKQRGNKAWLAGEVPYLITSNTAAAMQNARIVHEAAVRMTGEGTLKPNEPIVVVEMASGLGLFALNFIRAFQDIDREAGTNFSSRLRYYFTDFSEENVRNAADNPVFKNLENSGTIVFGILDATKPQTIQRLDTKKQEPLPERITGVIGNYLHCCLPTAMLRKQDEILKQKHVKLSLRVPENVQDKEAYAREFVEKPVGEKITENLVEDISWHDLEDDFFDHPLHEDVIREGTVGFPVASILYPRGSFACIQGTLPRMLEGSVFLISDKGYANKHYMRGERACEPSIHGNSFAHSLNFPLVEILAKKLGHSAIRTTDTSLSIHTILIEKRPTSTLDRLFEELFVHGNENVASSDFYAAGQKFEDAGEFDRACRFYERTLRFRRYDAHVYLRLGNCLAETGDYERAIDTLTAGRAYDNFREYDFDFRIGYTYHKEQRYEDALNAYHESIRHFPSEITHYNIGLCEEELKNFDAAMRAYRASIAINPNYEKARTNLDRLAEKLAVAA
jgi:hypothetical protein